MQPSPKTIIIQSACCRSGYLLCCSENTCSHVPPAKGWCFYFVFPFFCLDFLERVVPKKNNTLKDVCSSFWDESSIHLLKHYTLILLFNDLKILFKLDWGGHSPLELTLFGFKAFKHPPSHLVWSHLVQFSKDNVYFGDFISLCWIICISIALSNLVILFWKSNAYDCPYACFKRGAMIKSAREILGKTWYAAQRNGSITV